MRKEFIGWLGGHYDKFGFYNSKEDADRGISPDDLLFEVMDDFDGKKVRIIVEVIEE